MKAKANQNSSIMRKTSEAIPKVKKISCGLRLSVIFEIPLILDNKIGLKMLNTKQGDPWR